MLRYLPVRRIHARQILDSRGVPTVEVEATVGEGIIGIEGYTARAIVPSGTSTGRFEAIELRDGEKGCYLGLGVQKAVENVNTRLAEVIVGENALDQVRIDELLEYLWQLQERRQWHCGSLCINIWEAVIRENFLFL